MAPIAEGPLGRSGALAGKSRFGAGLAVGPYPVDSRSQTGTLRTQNVAIDYFESTVASISNYLIFKEAPVAQ